MVNRKYIAGMNGIRTLAVLGVIFYHLLPNKMPGGYLGVPLFFVISGYLMTTSVRKRREKSGDIELKQLYLRRLRRLLPPLVFFLFICGAVLPFIDRSLMRNFREIVASSLLFVNNWWQLFNGESYFDRFTGASPFSHLWYLSIEGQFYLVWLFLLKLYYRVADDDKLLAKIISIGIVLSAATMAVFYTPANVNIVYFGTFSRVFSLLLGALLSVVLSIYRTELEKASRYTGFFAAGACLMIVLVCFFHVRDTSAIVYRGGMLVFSLIAALLVGTVIQFPDVDRLMSNPLFAWCGSRSYEIYLWQFPVMIVYETLVHQDGSHLVLHTVVQLSVILLISEVSYRIVQRTVYLSGLTFSKNGLSKLRHHKAALFAVMLLGISFVAGFIQAPSGKNQAANDLQRLLEKNQKALNKESSAQKEKSAVKKMTPAELEAAKKISLTGFGDSILLSAAPSIQEIFPNSYIDAEVGRQLFESIEDFEKLKKEQTFGDVILVVLGANGSFSAKDMDNLMNVADGKPVFFVNTTVNRKWQKSVNTELAKTAKRFDNAHLIDWKTYSQHHDDWFEEDDIHMNHTGAGYFAEYVAQLIIKELKK